MFVFLFIPALFLTSFMTWAGVEVGGTRVVYNGALKQASISIYNPDDKPYLIQSWVDSKADGSGEDDRFIVTPPLFRLESRSQNSVRIMYTGKQVPLDRESVYWLNIKSIPSTSSDASNQLFINVKSVMKLFYRPPTLEGDPALAAGQLEFKQRNGRLYIYNPTPFYITLYDLKIDRSLIEGPDMIPPKEEVDVSALAQKGKVAVWRVINDFGGISKEINKPLSGD